MLTRRLYATSTALAAFIPATKSAAKSAKQIFAANPNATPKPPYSPAVGFGALLFVSGKASYNAPDPKDIRSCVRYAFDQIEAELKNAGSSIDNVLKVQVFLRNMDDYAAMNEIFSERFPKDPPARTTIAPIIPRESLVEIDVIASR